jgi:hypothetical protein
MDPSTRKGLKTAEVTPLDLWERQHTAQTIHRLRETCGPK